MFANPACLIYVLLQNLYLLGYTLKSKLNEKSLKSKYNIGQFIVPQILKKTPA